MTRRVTGVLLRKGGDPPGRRYVQYRVLAYDTCVLVSHTILSSNTYTDIPVLPVQCITHVILGNH
jgi:hypothetical protein